MCRNTKYRVPTPYGHFQRCISATTVFRSRRRPVLDLQTLLRLRLHLPVHIYLCVRAWEEAVGKMVVSTARQHPKIWFAACSRHLVVWCSAVNPWTQAILIMPNTVPLKPCNQKPCSRSLYHGDLTAHDGTALKQARSWPKQRWRGRVSKQR